VLSVGSTDTGKLQSMQPALERKKKLELIWAKVLVLIWFTRSTGKGGCRTLPR